MIPSSVETDRCDSCGTWFLPDMDGLRGGPVMDRFGREDEWPSMCGPCSRGERR